VLTIVELLIGFSNTMLGINQTLSGEKTFNVWVGLPLLAFGLFLLFGLTLPLHRKIQRLKAEKEIME